MSFEPVEERLLLATTAGIVDGTLLVEGDATDEVIALRLSPDGTQLEVDDGGDGTAEHSFALSDFDDVSVTGNGGNDAISIDVSQGNFTDAKPTTLEGGAGNDTLVGGSGGETLHGAEGDDLLEGRSGDDVLDGGPGADRLRGQTGRDLLLGRDGDDLLDGGSQSDTLYGHGGDDTLRGKDGDDRLFGGDDDDLVIGFDPGNDTVDGGAGRDRWEVHGTDQDDAYQIDWNSKAGKLLAERRGADGALAERDVAREVEELFVVALGGRDAIDLSRLDLADLAAAGLAGVEVNAGKDADTILGSEGSDTLMGGAGDDVLAVSGTGFASLAGGDGTDTLRLDGAGITLDLPAIPDKRISGIERIDIRGDGANTLTLNLLEVLNLSDESNTLIVDASFGDVVNIGPGWTFTGLQTLDGSLFSTYTQGAATLLVGGQLALGDLLTENGGDGTAGFVIEGTPEPVRWGWSVSSAGDVNDDGFDDVIIGTACFVFNTCQYGGVDESKVYVVFGRPDGFDPKLKLSDIDGTNGFLVRQDGHNDFGLSVSAAGDVNGDGIDDLVIGADLSDPVEVHGPGQAFVVFGRTDGFAPVLDVTDLDGSNGFAINGINDIDYTGFDVSAAGDVNGDGIDDLLIGAWGADPDGKVDAAAVYLVFGRLGGFGASVELSSLDGTGGFVLQGINPGDRAAYVARAGDVNGDGFSDMFIGAHDADPNGKDAAGQSYLVFGKDGRFGAVVDLASLDGTDGFVINGIDAGDRSGVRSFGGDFNGDGFDDLVIGGIFADPHGNAFAGQSYVIFGKPSGFPATLELSSLDGTGGFVINGIDAVDLSSPGDGAVDLNGDGYDDLIIGATRGDPNGKENAGEVYVVFGSSGGIGATLELSSLDGTDGFVLNGIDVEDRAGIASTAGDVNGDGFDDLIIGAYAADVDGIESAGEAYLVFGGDFTGAVTHQGDSGDNVLMGDFRADVMIGGRGADTLVGGGGADVLRGGEGDDVLAVGNSRFARIVGGNGTDTLRLDRFIATLDLPAIPDNRITGIERIDLTDSGAKTLTLNVLEVLNLSDESNSLTVFGDAEDRVDIGPGWTRTGTELIDETPFATFTQGAATLKVSAAVSTTGPAVFELSSLLPANGGDGTTGFVVYGSESFDDFGEAVRSAGDFNGDGFDDVIFTAPGANPDGKADAGVSYLLFGKPGGFEAVLGVASLDGTNGFAMGGINPSDAIGQSVSGAGDVNGDGLDDLLIGAERVDAGGNDNAGQSYVVFGTSAAIGPSLDLSTLDGTNGFAINGIDAGDGSGWEVDLAGDVNGDGYADLVIGARHADPDGLSSAGESYVVFGKPGGFPPTLELASLDGSNGFVINGVDADDLSGRSVSGAGDINGDSFDDLVIGALYADPNGVSNAGESYVVFGRPGFSASLELAPLDGTDGFTINGRAAGDYSGRSVSGAGDVNGDGFDDLIIAAFGADPGGRERAGEGYVVFGKSGGFGATLDLSSLDGTNGFVIEGIDPFDAFGGFQVSAAGDVNGDGVDDLVIGLETAGLAGETYVVFGNTRGFGPTLELSSLDGTGGFVLYGVWGNDDRSGGSVGGAGDVNGDGFDDLVIGAWLENESYVVFGGDFTGAVTHQGDTCDNVLIGNFRTDVMIGGTGADTLVGGGGADVLRGGEGDDVLAVADAAFARIVGGNGTDTLRLDGAGITLDLPAIPDNRITGIERIDLRGDGANTLTLNLLEVLNLSDDSNSLFVDATFDDVVDIGPGWTFTGIEILDGELFSTYTQGAATLLVAGQFELSSLLPENGGDGSAGFVLDGSGFSVSDAGDVNGDGFDDLITNAVYVVFGGPAVIEPVLELASLDGTNGFMISEGSRVSSAGDVNGDGLDDVIIGDPGADPFGNLSAGASYVVFGRRDGFAETVDVSELDRSEGFVINGIRPGDLSGWSVSSAGDINTDGFDELLIGAIRADPNGEDSAGESYVVFGRDRFEASVNLAGLDQGAQGFVLKGIDEDDLAGWSVSSAGDVNGDGFDDLLIGALRADPGGCCFHPGVTYVVFGKPGGFGPSFELSSLDGTNGFAIPAVGPLDTVGHSVSSAGDINGDGFDDLVLGAPDSRTESFVPNTGVSYVVFGKAAGFPPSLNVTDLDGSSGFAIHGLGQRANTGYSVGSAGDVNGDGFNDLLIGAPGPPGGPWDRVGHAYVVFGRAGGFGAVVELATLDGTDGFALHGIVPGDRAGFAVSTAGDVNGDGFDDLLVGARQDNQSYVVFGGDFSGAVTHQGSDGSDVLVGDAGANVMIGGKGADTLVGAGGADVLRGGEGDDVLAVSDAAFARIVGGNGTDTLRLDGQGHFLNLVDIADNRIQGIERIDIAGRGSNSLTLDVLEVLNLSDHSNRLVVIADGDDQVAFDPGWTKAGLEFVGTELFNVYTQGAATLLISIEVDALRVNSTADPGDGVCDVNECTLREAVAVANANAGPDTILVQAGTYVLTAGQLSITDDLALVGAGSLNTVIDGGANDRVFDASAALDLFGVTIQNGSAAAGGGIRSDGARVALISTVVSNNTADDTGGGILVNDGTLALIGSVVSGNSAESGAGIWASQSNVSIEHSIISQNAAASAGGGVLVSEGTVTLSNSVLSDNVADQQGGALYSDGATVMIDQTTITDNRATAGSGGALWSGAGPVTITGSTLSRNATGEDGGAISATDGVLNVTASLVSSNTGARWGGDRDPRQHRDHQ